MKVVERLFSAAIPDCEDCNSILPDIEKYHTDERALRCGLELLESHLWQAHKIRVAMPTVRVAVMSEVRTEKLDTSQPQSVSREMSKVEVSA